VDTTLPVDEQIRPSYVGLFRGQKDGAKPTGTTFCAYMERPGGSRMARGSQHSAEELLRWPVAAGRAQSIEPMPGPLDPHNVRRMHQSLHHVGAEAP
jgi:hypothetical protein